MLRLVRSAINNGTKSASGTVKTTIAKREFTRNFIYMCKQPPIDSLAARASTTLHITKPGMFCECGCGIRGAHTKGQ